MPHLSFFKLRIWKQQAEPPAVLISSCSAMRLFRRRQKLLCVRVLGMVEQLVHRDFVRIVIAGRSEDYCYPCGMCRQFMKEFAPEMQVICLNGKGEAKELTLRELLPYGFDSTFLPGEQ